jgi:hypothetical protein
MNVVLAAAVAFGVALLSHAQAEPPPARPIVVQSSHGFDWTASGLGAGAGFGLALALVGSIALIRTSRR